MRKPSLISSYLSSASLRLLLPPIHRSYTGGSTCHNTHHSTRSVCRVHFSSLLHLSQITSDYFLQLQWIFIFMFFVWLFS